MAGRRSVEPNLAASLHARNHLLEDMFSARVIKVEEKKKKKKEGDESDSTTEYDHEEDDRICYVDRVGVREAFQSKKQRNLGIRHLGGGGVVKKSKKSQVSVGKSSKLGGVFGNQKSPKCQRIPKTKK